MEDTETKKNNNMTQGIISIMKGNKVMFKCVVGCNGFKAEKTAMDIKKKGKYNLKSIWDICVKNDFGDSECSLIVQSGTDWLGAGREDGEKLSKLYIEKFSDPNFNPRWECGMAPHIKIIKY